MVFWLLHKIWMLLFLETLLEALFIFLSGKCPKAVSSFEPGTVILYFWEHMRWLFLEYFLYSIMCGSTQLVFDCPLLRGTARWHFSQFFVVYPGKPGYFTHPLTRLDPRANRFIRYWLTTLFFSSMPCFQGKPCPGIEPGNKLFCYCRFFWGIIRELYLILYPREF